jgi:hypothetical protein
VAQTAADTLAWFAAVRGLEDPLKAGLSTECEQDVLAALDAQAMDD